MGNTTLFIAIILTGLSAGLCFTWGNAVTTGIANLNDQGYLQAFQAMNRTIQNPLFFLVFFGPILLTFWSSFINRTDSISIFWLCFSAGLIYLVGLALVTIFGNVPLNEMLDKTDLLSSSVEELAQLRNQFEQPWNRFHTIRTVSSTISFGLLTLAALIK